MFGSWIRSAALPGFALLLACAPTRPAPPVPAQNPSPMVERTRAHERLEERALPGLRTAIEGLLPRPVSLYLPERAPRTGVPRLLLHFHGAAYLAEHAVARATTDYALAVVHLGAGSSVYDTAFRDAAVLDVLLTTIGERFEREAGVRPRGLDVSAFSAGYGAVRALLREARHFDRIDGVLLLDGLHTGYRPPRTVLAEGGALDTEPLEPFVRFAEAAVRGEKRMLVTHSEIFPGTFASTTETADYLLERLSLHRTAVLEWGPLGMQQLSEAGAGGFLLLGFAGNSAPDHVDHAHGAFHFLTLLREP